MVQFFNNYFLETILNESKIEEQEDYNVIETRKEKKKIIIEKNYLKNLS